MEDLPKIRSFSYLLDGVARALNVYDWGDERAAHAIVCVHGLSRNGRDFDALAQALSGHARVLCPDMPGRGLSQRLGSATDYAIPTYVSAVTQILSQLGVKQYDWVGTSMGGLIGMVLAATPQSGMRRFVCNDVGPTIERAALERIGAYMGGRAPAFESYEQLFRAAQLAINGFGPLKPEQKHHIVSTSCVQGSDGKWRFNVDPLIGEAFVAALAQPPVDLWPLWQTGHARTLILRGEESDLLSSETVQQMCATHHDARAHAVAQTGHAPMMMDAPTISVVCDFLLGA